MNLVQSGKYTRVEEWEDFLNFEKWALENGFTDNSVITIPYRDVPVGPENCIIEQSTSRSTHITGALNVPKTSKYKGVSYCAPRNKWNGNVEVNKKRYRKRFQSEVDAAIWRDDMAYKLVGMPVYLNFPERYNTGAQ